MALCNSHIGIIIAWKSTIYIDIYPFLICLLRQLQSALQFNYQCMFNTDHGVNVLKMRLLLHDEMNVWYISPKAVRKWSTSGPRRNILSQFNLTLFVNVTYNTGKSNEEFRMTLIHNIGTLIKIYVFYSQREDIKDG